MSKRILSASLEKHLEQKITSLEQENKYIQNLLHDLSPSSGASSLEDATGQIGTSTPRYFAAADTFIANPSNVSLGIISRMVETDDTVLAACQLKSLMMISKIGEYQHPEPEIAEFVRGFIQRMEGPTWAESLEAMSSYGVYGFSVSEKIWGLNKKNQKVPIRVKTYHPTTLAFEVDEFGDITEQGIIQFVIQDAQISNPNNFFPYFQSGFQVKNPFSTPVDRILPYRIQFANTYGLVRIPKNKVIHHVNNSFLAFGSPYGKSAVRTAHLAWQLKVFFMKQMGIAGKRQASPFIHATAPLNGNQIKIPQSDGSVKMMNAIDALSDVLARRETDDSIVTGPADAGYVINAIAAQSNLDQFLNVIDHLNTYIFRSFLLPSLVMTAGESGSRALGDKHFEIVDRISEADAQKFGLNIINQLVRPAIEMNFGEMDDYGHFAQRPQSIDERVQLANMFASLASAGYMQPMNKTDNEAVRSNLHLNDADESFFTQPSPNMPGPDDAHDFTDDEEAPEETTDDKDKER